MPLSKSELAQILARCEELSRRTPASPEDVAELRRLAPLLADGPIDELACDVIQQALKRRALVRQANAGS